MALNNNVGLFNVLPPTLEDAGLEDSALPTNAIQEAFKRAADALKTAPWHVQSNAGSIFRGVTFEEEPSGIRKGTAALGEEESCVDTKAGGVVVEEGHDLVVGQDVGLYESDKVEFGKEGGPKLGDKGCVEGLAGDRGEDKDTTDESEDGPILVLA